MNDRSIVLRKMGSFYQVFDDDVYILNYLFNYKVVNYKCGFPVGAIDKVVSKLEEKNINYIIKGDSIVKKRLW